MILHRKLRHPTAVKFDRDFQVRNLERFSTVYYEAIQESLNSRGKPETNVYVVRTRHMDFLEITGGEAMNIEGMGLYQYEQDVVKRLRQNCPTYFGGGTVHNPNAV
jgi:hypothetical protein